MVSLSVSKSTAIKIISIEQILHWFRLTSKCAVYLKSVSPSICGHLGEFLSISTHPLLSQRDQEDSKYFLCFCSIFGYLSDYSYCSCTYQQVLECFRCRGRTAECVVLEKGRCKRSKLHPLYYGAVARAHLSAETGLTVEVSHRR